MESGKDGNSDDDVLEYADFDGWIAVSHDVNTMKAAAEKRVRDGLSMADLLLAAQDKPSREIAESLVLIWKATQAEEWCGVIAFLPL